MNAAPKLPRWLGASPKLTVSIATAPRTTRASRSRSPIAARIEIIRLSRHCFRKYMLVLLSRQLQKYLRKVHRQHSQNGGSIVAKIGHKLLLPTAKHILGHAFRSAGRQDLRRNRPRLLARHPNPPIPRANIIEPRF